MRIIYCVLLCLASIPSTAQQNFDVTDPSATDYGTISFLDMSSLGKKKVENISYDDVRGSAFWNDNWNSALFFLSSNRVVKVPKAKLNLYTNEVHFIGKDGTELSLENTKVLKVIFYKGADTTTVLGVFESLPDSLSASKISYYRVLNNGKFRMLILQKNLVKEGEYDPIAGKREHSFYSKTTYLIANDQDLIPVKSFDQTAIFRAINASAEQKQWVFENKYKLKNETQVAAFFIYCNSHSK